MKNTYKNIIRKALYCFCFMILIAGSFFLYLSEEPRKIPFIRQYIENYINRNLGDVAVAIGDLSLHWEDKKNLNIDVRLNAVRVSVKNKGDIIIPYTKLSINLYQLFAYKNYQFLKSIELNPEIIFSVHSHDSVDKKSTRLQQFAMDHISLFFSSLFSKCDEFLHEFISAFEGVAVQVAIFNDKPPISVVIHKIILDVMHYSYYTALQACIELKIENEDFIISAFLDTSKADLLEIRGEFKNLTPSILAKFTQSSQMNELMKFYIDGIFSFDIDNRYKANNIRFAVSDYTRFFKKGDVFDDDIVIEEFRLEGKCTLNCASIEIDDFKLSAKNLEIYGKFIKNEENLLNGSIVINPIAVSDLYKYWPNVVLPDVKKWLVESLKGGLVQHANISLNLNLKEMANGNIKRDDVNVVLILENASLNYMSSVPSVEIQKASVTVSAHDVEIKAEKATLYNSIVSNFVGLIKYYGAGSSDESLNQDKVAIYTLRQSNILNYLQEVKEWIMQSIHTINTAGSNQLGLNARAEIAGNLQTLMDLGFLHAGYEKGQVKDYKGDVSASVQFFVPFDQEITLGSINLYVSGMASGVKTPKLFRGYNINAKNLNFIIKDQILDVYAKQAMISGMLPAEIKMQYILPDNRMLISGGIFSDASKFTEAGIYIPEYIKGFIETKFSGVIGGVEEHYKYNVILDFTKSDIEFTSLGIHKYKGDSGKLELNLIANSNNDDWYLNYRLFIKDFQSEGSGAISGDMESSVKIYSANSSFYDLPLSFSYTSNQESETLKLEGDVADLKKINWVHFSKVKRLNSKTFALDTSFKKVLLSDSIALDNPRLLIRCDASRCIEMKLGGNFDSGKYINLFYEYPVLAIISNDAGRFLNGFKIYNNITGGHLEFKAKLEDLSNFSSNLIINKFHISNAPILAKLLSLAAITSVSFKGVSDIISGKGISFDSLICKIDHDFPTIYFKECRMNGSVFNMKGSSVINYQTNELRAAGVLVPVNIVNSVFNAIPLIGKLLSGGKDNGIISTNFYASGTLDKGVQITINPISLLAPGFLGEFFNQERSVLKKSAIK